MGVKSKRKRINSDNVSPSKNPERVPKVDESSENLRENTDISDVSEKLTVIQSDTDNEETKIKKKKKKREKCNDNTEITFTTEKLNATQSDGDNEETKLKKKKKKRKVEESVDDATEFSTSKKKSVDGELESAKSKDNGCFDPGWDFSVTSVTLPGWQKASIWSDEELDSDDEESEGKKHISKAEARRLKKVEEEEAAKREQRLLDGEVETPTTEAEFERLCVSSPDSSLVWIQYMASSMQAGELAKAREVARRAVTRINYRLETEKLNVFLAWLNLENSFGNPEALDKVLKEALQCCDQFKIYSQLAIIYGQSGKMIEAEKIYKVLVRKFSKEKEVWIKYGIFNFKNNKLSEGRFLLQRSLQSLDKKDHLGITSKFAQIEFKFGDPERGKTMFETILSNYPRRTDLWSVYVDQLVKSGDIDAARALYRRIATLSLQARKMKALFKKWLEFESVHGSEAGVSEVKLSAQKYLEGKGGLAEAEREEEMD